MLEILNKLKNLLLIDEETLLNYMYSSSALPEPLPDDKEKELLYKLAIENNSLAKKELIEHNLRLVMYIAKKYEMSKTSFEDLVSVGSIGLIKAIDSFNPDKNIKLATYASRCIENEILMHLRKLNKIAMEISIDEPIKLAGDDKKLMLQDIIPAEETSPDDDIEMENNKKILVDLIENLSERERIIIKMRFGLDGYKEFTQKEVADLMKISQSYISRLEKKILNKLKKSLINYDE